jgi:hypothetical protein
MAASIEEKSAEAAQALRQIKRIAVRVFPIKEESNREIEDLVSSTEQQLLRENWRKVVRIHEDDESVLVFLKYAGSLIDGVAVMVVELGDEAVLVNMMGEIDPKTLGTLMYNAGLFKEAGFEELLENIEPEMD